MPYVGRTIGEREAIDRMRLGLSWKLERDADG